MAEATACIPSIPAPCRSSDDAETAQATADRLAREEERRRRHDLWRRCGAPMRHREAVDAGPYRCRPEHEAGVAEARRVVAAGGLLLLLGPWGTGKTHLAACLLKHTALATGLEVRYRRLADLISEMRQECYANGNSDAALMARLSRLGLLVIDEVHHRRWTADEQLWLTRLLDHRYGEKTATVLIANLVPAAMAEVLDPAVIDRMREGGAIVELAGESRRGEE